MFAKEKILALCDLVFNGWNLVVHVLYYMKYFNLKSFIQTFAPSRPAAPAGPTSPGAP